ncbi:ribosomal protein S2, flavodoxin-like domain-containing protein [Aspergillus egyptiacus]|nr:ribosomal protein S2, flavodoxin-like domain-containing protein [Aspergillus egyptiacus]
MIVRQLCVRQSRQLFALNRQAYNLRRFSSIETPTQTSVDTAVQTPTEESIQSRPEQFAAPNPIETASQSSTSLVDVFKQKEQQRNQFKQLGTVVKGAYRPDNLLHNPPSAKDITLELLLANQTHLGHSTSRWNPQNSRYIFGIRDGIHIISLDITAAYLRRAAKVVEEVAARGGLILFVGTRKGQKEYIVRAAELAKSYHIFDRWIPGTLTNGQQILGHCEKKVVNMLDEELPEYKESLIEHSVLKPDLVVCMNPVENVVLLHECGLHNVPTIGVIDTDADPTKVTYPIPANDDSLRSVGLIAGALGRAGQAGQERRLRDAQEGKVDYWTVSEQKIRDPFGLEQKQNED